MVNYTTKHSVQKDTIDYFVDSACSRGSDHCRMCYVQAMEFQGDHITKDTETIVHELSSLNSQGYSVFIITSDLFSREDWKDVLKASGQKHVLTTGYHIAADPKLLDDLAEIGIEQIVVSANLSDVARELNLPDEDATKRAIEMARSKGISAMLSMIVNKHNYDRVYDMVEYAVSLGADNLRFLNLIPLFGDQDSALDEQEMKHFLDESYRLQESGKYPKSVIYISREGVFSSPYHKKGNSCTAGEERLLIGPDNLIYPCIFLVKPEFAIGRFIGCEVIIDADKKDCLPFKGSGYCIAWKYHTSRMGKE